MSLAFSRKHCRQMFIEYLRIRPCLFPQTRLWVARTSRRRAGE